MNDNAATENVLVKALKHVLNDDSFKINTPSMIKARKSGKSLLDWCLYNEMDGRFINFTIVSMILQSNLLQQIIMFSSATTLFTLDKQKLWKEFYQLRISQVTRVC